MSTHKRLLWIRRTVVEGLAVDGSSLLELLLHRVGHHFLADANGVSQVDWTVIIILSPSSI